VDALAESYDKWLEEAQIVPLIRTQPLKTEGLLYKYEPETFDFVTAANCIDHHYNPILALFNMASVTKLGGYILMWHRRDEATTEKHAGLHQWNLALSEDKTSYMLNKKDLTKTLDSVLTLVDAQQYAGYEFVAFQRRDKK
jgi:hypothetical protein